MSEQIGPYAPDMYVVMSIHTPKPEYRQHVVASMQRFGAAMRSEPGLLSVETLADESSDRLVGLARFESEADAHRLLPLARAAVADDDFEMWEVNVEGWRLRAL